MSKVIDKKKGYIRFLGIGMALGLWYLLYLWVQAMAEDGARGVHLEWEEPAVSWAELEQGRENETKGAGIYLYLWKREEGSARNQETGQEVQTALITGVGEMREVLPVRLISGSYLMSENPDGTTEDQKAEGQNTEEEKTVFRERVSRDTEGCLVSQSVAEALWGGQDVIGQSLQAGDRLLTVRGVTMEKQAKVYCYPESEKWEQERCSSLEVYIAPETAAVETVRTQKALAEAFLARHGITAASSGNDYQWQSNMKLTMIRVAGALLALCAGCWYVVPAIRVLVQGAFYKYSLSEEVEKEGQISIRYAPKGGFWRKIICLVFLLLAILLLFRSFQWVFQDFVVPEDWIPPAWSDFDFWGEKWQEWIKHRGE